MYGKGDWLKGQQWNQKLFTPEKDQRKPCQCTSPKTSRFWSIWSSVASVWSKRYPHASFTCQHPIKIVHFMVGTPICWSGHLPKSPPSPQTATCVKRRDKHRDVENNMALNMQAAFWWLSSFSAGKPLYGLRASIQLKTFCNWIYQRAPDLFTL